MRENQFLLKLVSIIWKVLMLEFDLSIINSFSNKIVFSVDYIKSLSCEIEMKLFSLKNYLN